MTKLCGVALAVFVLGQSTVRALARSEPVQGEVLSSDTDDSFDSLSGLEVHDQVVTSQLHPSSTRLPLVHHLIATSRFTTATSVILLSNVLLFCCV